METLLKTFLENFYWIDVSNILLLLLIFYGLILVKSKKILAKNQAYNNELKAMRTEIYTEYEKNFFI